MSDLRYQIEDRGYGTPCWIWQGAVNNQGYGRIGARSYAHRVSWEAANGPIPTGLTIDHLCRVPLCINPAHLEPVTMAENIRRGMGASAVNARKTHCKRGHELAGDNLYMRPGGARNCRTCRREADEAKKVPKEPQTHCRHGHPMTGDNLIIEGPGWRRCRECKRRTGREFMRRKAKEVSR